MKYACLVCQKPTTGDLCSDACVAKWFKVKDDRQMELAVLDRQKTGSEDAVGSTPEDTPVPRGRLKLA